MKHPEGIIKQSGVRVAGILFDRLEGLLSHSKVQDQVLIPLTRDTLSAVKQFTTPMLAGELVKPLRLLSKLVVVSELQRERRSRLRSHRMNE